MDPSSFGRERMRTSITPISGRSLCGGLDGEDLGYIIKTVAFSLHPSFSVPVRLKEEHPFEVTETGWGEFEVGIRIYFVDDAVPPSIFRTI